MLEILLWMRWFGGFVTDYSVRKTYEEKSSTHLTNMVKWGGDHQEGENI